MNMKALINPGSVALIGANAKKGFGGCAARNLAADSNKCKFYFVNPNYEELYGHKCYPSLEDLPEVVDLVELAIPKYGVNEQLELAGRLGVKAAIVYASGYTEEHSEEGLVLDAELRNIAEKYDMSILGPNCMGLLNIADGKNLMGLAVNEDYMKREPLIAILSHSGALSSGIAERGCYPLGYMVSVGNGTFTAMEDFMAYFIEDAQTRVLALYLEGLKKPQLFLECLKRAAAKRKPVVILKTGRSEIAARSAASHTGSLAGTFQSYEAVFRKYGAVSVDTLEELILTSSMLAVLHPQMPESTKIAGFNLSGGGNVLMAEAAYTAGVEFAAFDEQTLAKLQQFIPAFATPTNPLDATTDLFYKPENITGIIKAMSDCKDVGYILAGQDMGRTDNPSMEVFVSGLAQARTDFPDCKPVIMSCVTEKERNDKYRKILFEAGIPLLSSVTPSLHSIARLNDFIRYSPADHRLEIPEIAAASGPDTITLTESESKRILAENGIPVPREILICDRREMNRIHALKFPMAAKVSSADIAHKSDAGGVVLNIETVRQAENAYETILMNCKKNCPAADIEGIVFQEMAPPGQEFIIGVTNDPQLGPMIMVGLGGIFVEIFKDFQLVPAPVHKKEALQMLHNLQASKLLYGYRGSRKLDIDALADIICKVSEYAGKNSRSLKEMDINPVILYEHGVIAVDALIIKNKEKEGGL